MPYRSRLQRIQEKRNFNKAILMITLGIGLILLSIFYGVKAMAFLALAIDKLKFGENSSAIVDSIPPAPPMIWADYTATNSATLSIRGSSEPETTVFLLRGEEILAEKKADSEGRVEFEYVTLKSGDNEFWAKAKDSAGNNSQQSKSLIVVFSDKAPDLTIEKPEEEQKFTTKDNPIEVKGKTVGFARIFVNGRLAVADSEGVFIIKIYLTEGENILKFKVVDPTGNEVEKEFKVFLQQ